MIDIDHFKQFNAKFGHDAGDIVLQTVAKKLKSHAKHGDISCRLGGEEFVLIYQNTSLNQAIKRAEELRKSIEALKLHHNGNNLGSITISQGLSLFPDDAWSLESLLKKSDEALYKAKNKGRNHIVVYTEKNPIV